MPQCGFDGYTVPRKKHVREDFFDQYLYYFYLSEGFDREEFFPVRFFRCEVEERLWFRYNEAGIRGKRQKRNPDRSTDDVDQYGSERKRGQKMKTIRAAVIGCGNISVMHLDSITHLEGLSLAAVCDVRPERAKQAAEKYHTKAYTDYRKLLEEEKPDAVHLCLPHYLHTPAAQEALRTGVHVLSEKPMSIRYEDAQETVKLAERCGLQYGVIFQCRYNTPSQLVKRRITDGRLGTVKAARSVLTWYRPEDYYAGSDWKGTWEKEGGGVIIDQAIHSLDLANWFIASSPVSVEASLHNRRHRSMVVEDTGEGLVRYENGSTLFFYAMNNYPVDEPIELRLVCEHGTARLSYDEAVISYEDGTVEAVKNRPQQIVSYTGGKPYWGSQHAVQIDQFYRAVRGLEELEISGKEALKIQRIICEIYRNPVERTV